MTALEKKRSKNSAGAKAAVKSGRDTSLTNAGMDHLLNLIEEYLQDVIWVLDLESSKFVYVSPSVYQLRGYTPKEVLQQPLDEVLTPESFARVTALLEENLPIIRSGKVPEPVLIELDQSCKDGHIISTEVTANYHLSAEGKLQVVGVTRDITQRKLDETLRDVLFRIADAAHSLDNLPALYAEIHVQIGRVMQAQNFYIALYEESTDLLTFVYSVDEKDNSVFTPMNPGKGLTALVLRSGKSHIFHPEGSDRQVEILGARSRSWLGVPLKLEGKTIGVMAVQSYVDENVYGEREQGVLDYVANQVAQAINQVTLTEKVRGAERRNKALIMNAPDGIVVTDAKGQFTFASPSILRIFGYTQADKGLFSVDDLTHPDDLVSVKQVLAGIFSDPSRVEVLEYRAKHKDGSFRWIQATFSNLVADPAVGGVVVNLKDVTTSKQVAQSLVEMNEKYELISENSADVIWVLDVATLTFPYVSPSIMKLSGWTYQEMQGMPMDQVVSAESFQKIQQSLGNYLPKVMAGEEVPALTLELDEKLKGGGTVPIEVTTRFVTRADGRIQAVGITRDITERRKSLEILQQAQINLEKAQSAARMGSWEIAPDSCKASWSREMFYLFQMEISAEVPDRQVLVDLIHPEDVEKLREAGRQVHATGESQTVIFRARTVRGNERTFEVSMFANCAPGGEVTQLHGTMFDITEAYAAQQRITRSEETLRAMVNATLESFLMLGVDGTVLMANEYTARRMGLTLADMLGKVVYDFLPQELAAKRRELVDQVFRTRQPISFEDQRADIYFLNNIYPVLDPQGKVDRVVIYGRDITLTRHAMKRVQESEALLNEAQQMAHTGNWVLDIQSDAMRWSDELFRILDMEPGDVQPTSDLFLEFVHPEDKPAAQEAYHVALIDARKQEIIERVITRKGALKYVSEQWQTLFQEGKPVRAMGTVQDITEQVIIDQALRQEKGKLEKIATTVPGVIYEYRLLKGGKSYLSYVSPRVQELYQLDPEKLSRSLASAMKPIDRDDLRRFTRELMRSARRLEPLRIEFRYQHPEKGMLWLELNATPVRDAEEGYTYYGIVTDISARKQSELEFQQHNDDLALINDLVEAMNRGESLKDISRKMAQRVREEFNIEVVSLYLVDEDRKTIRTSSFSTENNVETKIEKALGHPIPEVKVPLVEGSKFLQILNGKKAICWSSNEAMAARILEIVNADSTSAATKAVMKRLIPYFIKIMGVTSIISYPLVLDDQPLGILEFASRRPFSTKDMQRLMHIGSSLTSAIIRHQVLERLKESNDRFDLISRNIHEVFWLTNRLEGRMEYYGPKFEQVFGLKREQVQGNPLFHMSYVHPEDLGLVRQAQQDIEAGKKTDLYFRYNRPDGRLTWLHETSMPIFDERGRLLRTVGVTADITEAKLAELRLKEREGFLGSIVASSPGDILMIGLDGRYLYSNRRWVGQSDAAFMQTRFMDQVAPEQAELVQRLIERTIHKKTIQHAEMQLMTESGTYHWTDVVFSPMIVDDRVESVTIFTYDIHERKQAELALAASEARFKSLAAELEERVAERTAEVQDLYDNAPAGYHSLDEVGRIVMVNLTECNWLGYTRDELLNLASFRDLFTPASRKTFDDLYERFKVEGTLKDIEFELICKDGSILPVVVNAVAVYDANGKYIHSRSTLFNNTERKKAQDALQESETSLRKNRDQLSAANAALEKASRLKDEFLASMSHELRTPLTGILGLSEALQLDTYGDLTERQRNALVNIETSGKHLLELINDILDLSKIEAEKLDLNLELCAVADACQASLQLTRGMAQKKNLSVDFKANPATAIIRADSRRLKQMLVNLLSNAIKFTPEDGSLGLEVTGDEANQVIHLAVWDKGIGIHPEDMDKLFKPFVQLDNSLSRLHSGTGLGLSLVGRLAEMHGGSVKVESVFGAGSRFTITLPWAVSNQPASVQAGQGWEAIHRCLLIERDAIQQKQIAGCLQNLGIEYFLHERGLGAVEVALRIGPDAILLDASLPDIQAEQLLLDLKSIECIRDRILILSSKEEERGRYMELGAAGYLVKPFSLEDLKNEFMRAFSRKAEGVQDTKPTGEGVTVIFADDNAVILEAVCDYLRARGYNVIAARNGRELVQLAPNARAHIILTDIQMPGMDGLQAIHSIRASDDEHLKKVPIVAITALAMPGDENICLAAGANRYVSKPVPLGKMLEIIEELRLK